MGSRRAGLGNPVRRSRGQVSFCGDLPALSALIFLLILGHIPGRCEEGVRLPGAWMSLERFW
jgi:hypothetical protein